MSLTDRELSRVEEQRKENDVVVIVFLKAFTSRIHLCHEVGR